jgi:hypothetical protein
MTRLAIRPEANSSIAARIVQSKAPLTGSAERAPSVRNAKWSTRNIFATISAKSTYRFRRIVDPGRDNAE